MTSAKITSYHDLLASNPVLVSLTMAERQALQRASIFRKAEKGVYLITEGDESENVIFLLEGSVRVFHISSAGHEVTLKIFKAPSVFGEMENICKIPFLENVKVLEDDPEGWYCYTSALFADDRVILAYCAGNKQIGGLNLLQVTNVDVDWLYGE